MRAACGFVSAVAAAGVFFSAVFVSAAGASANPVGANFASANPANYNPAIPRTQSEIAIVVSIKNVGTNFTFLNRYLSGGEWVVKHIACTQGSCLVILRRP